MITSRTSARITGVLFILGTMPPMLATVFWGRSLASPRYLTKMAAHSVGILGIALFALCMGLACAGIGLSLYPVLKRHSEGQALAAAIKSVWGFVGLALMLVGAFTGMFGLLDSFSAGQFFFMMPILIQEMVLAFWLIVKGYREEERTA